MLSQNQLHQHLCNFRLGDNGSVTRLLEMSENGKQIPVYINEFWTSKQRQTHSIHEVSYRACFKPQLPRFFIELFTAKGETVYDPFNGRGTTIVEAALLGRNVIANDVNPLSSILSKPRVNPVSFYEIETSLGGIALDKSAKADIDLSMFYHRDTEGEIVSLRNFFIRRDRKEKLTLAEQWIQMVATNRLTGHSNGFFSVYTMPPNQAVSAERQKKINIQREQKPEYRNVRELILKKSKALLRDADSNQHKVDSLFLCGDASSTSAIPDSSVALVVTSPPFLDVVQYASDNWLRCWFNSIDAKKVGEQITMSKTVKDWSSKMQTVFVELFRVIKRNGVVAFEVGEVRKGKVKLEESVLPLGLQAGFECLGVLINEQSFTKTANIWGVSNNATGTNSNRVLIFRKP